MKETDFRKIETAEDFVALLKKHGLFREDDVTFEDIGDAGNMYVYAGNDLPIDVDMFGEMEIAALLVEGNVKADVLTVSDIVPEIGIFCVTGDVRCEDLLYMTESTGMVVGGDLVVDGIAYTDCGNSVLEVKKNLRARLFFNGQCSVDVKGTTEVQLDETATKEQLQKLGIDVENDQEPAEAVRAYFDREE